MFHPNKYNKFIGLETIDREYKVPSMNYAGTRVTDSEAVGLIKSNKFIFNQAILNNIISSFTYYFGKYFTAFMNSELESAELYYGVNDYGVVTGFPYQGEFNISFLEEKLSNMISGKYFKTLTNRAKLSDSYQITLQKIEYEKVMATNHFQKYQLQEVNNQKKMQKYYYEINLNMSNHMRYSTKLLTLIKDKVIRRELLSYIYAKLEHSNIMLYLKLQRKIKMGDFLSCPTHEEICKFKNDITNVYYWLTRFKDERIQFLKTIKPNRPTLDTRIYPNCLLSTVEHMIPNWMNNNENMNLYIIKLSFSPKNLSLSEKDIKYLYQGEYNYCVRSLDCMGNPCCIPS